MIHTVNNTTYDLAKGNCQKGVQVGEHGLAIAYLDDLWHERGNGGQASAETGTNGVGHNTGPAQVVVPVPAHIVPIFSGVIRTLFVGDTRIDNMKAGEYSGAQAVGHHSTEWKLQFGDFWVESRQEVTQTCTKRGADDGQPDPCSVCRLVGDGSGNKAAETKEQ